MQLAAICVGLGYSSAADRLRTDPDPDYRIWVEEVVRARVAQIKAERTSS